MAFPGFSSPGAALPGVYRLVSPVLTTGVKNGSLNDNITFVTNIPSLDYALRIWRIRWLMGFSAWGEVGGGIFSAQFFAQLTENQTKTAILATDTSYLDTAWFQIEQSFATAAGFFQLSPGPMEIIHDFNPMTTPFTVATKLNMVATLSQNTNTLQATTTFKPTVTLEYTLERLTPDLRDYLSKRLQIQGS
jgi:hypothetical protein